MATPSGHGDERQNTAVEKKFEDAQAKGYRPCTSSITDACNPSTDTFKGPTCHEMLDVRPSNVFLAKAFAPSSEQLAKFSNPKRKVTRRGTTADIDLSDDDEDVKTESKTFDEMVLDDSDDELPELSDILRPVKRQKTEQALDDDVSFVTYLAVLPLLILCPGRSRYINGRAVSPYGPGRVA